MEQLSGHDKRIQTVLELSGDILGSNRTAEDAGFLTGNKQSLLGNVVERAKEVGAWIPDIAGIVSKVIGNGQENDVFLSVDGTHVIKLNNFGLVPTEAKSLEGFIHRLITHNKLFPDLHFIDAVVNDTRISVAKINKVSIKHPGKRTT